MTQKVVNNIQIIILIKIPEFVNFSYQFSPKVVNKVLKVTQTFPNKGFFSLVYLENLYTF